ncbi:MAG: alpha/beta fold hydrolase [Bacteroidota bacterium]
MADPVLLLHGLARSERSMRPLARALRTNGFAPHLIDYPSRHHRIGELVDSVVAPAVEQLEAEGAERIHFVTHSLGGVLTRAYAARRFDAGNPLPDGCRAVMLAPPHRGSEVADVVMGIRALRAYFGPALDELGTDGASIPLRLGPMRGIETGVIAGDRNLYPILGRALPGPGDGSVAVERTRVDGIADWLLVHRTHALIPFAPDVTRATLRFLKTGQF